MRDDINHVFLPCDPAGLKASPDQRLHMRRDEVSAPQEKRGTGRSVQAMFSGSACLW